MDLTAALHAIILGIVEGLTEFLPVSSTGHLILAGSLLGEHSEKAKIFDVVIQFGAILAVCWEFRARIAAVTTGLASDRRAQRFALNVVVACIPAVLLGLAFASRIKASLFAPVPVAIALVVGGIVILFAEARNRRLAAQAGAGSGEIGDRRTAVNTAARVHSIDDLTLADALKVGIAQCFALIPGTSRSGSTIIGGMLFGLDRKVATEFSFFLAIPIIFGATVHDLYKARGLFDVSDVGVLLLGLFAAFVSAIVCVRWLMRFIATHDFTGFAWYRIIFGVLILATSYAGWVDWQ
ncbi:undecaprenyl-diphosphate phosphatase [Chitinasiproducens palmae]|uniref:Undecaprenyl-diphosphatase n=1 Tax=Chitinasiproducens palmae TaxID=1770053 RepID=A0A1H2PNM9_9BURK|nr:undecaprenyl-diphosphate phosphatase [Chitinasiproducens palmae]SDV47798.1 Undecaprenyl-diphosphatase [Chitinasiproducens palmae]